MTGDRFVDLLRHGAVAGGARFRGSTDDRLGSVGLLQMRAVVSELSGWDAVFSSPARRCAEPARELAEQRGLPLEIVSELAERHFGDWENRSSAEIPEDELERFWDDPLWFTPPGAETFQALRERVLRGWGRVLGSEAQFPLVITHGGVIRVTLGTALDIPADALLRIEVPPACRARLRVPSGEGRPSLVFLGGPHPCGAPF